MFSVCGRGCGIASGSVYLCRGMVGGVGVVVDSSDNGG